MRSFRIFFGLLAATLLTACAGAGPKGSALDDATRNSLRIEAVAVDISALGGVTQGQSASANSVKQIFKREAKKIVGTGPGPVPALINVRLGSVNLISTAQSLLIGGESVMKGTVTVLDRRNGNVIIPATVIDAGGGGWVLGGVVAAATRDDPATELRQMSQEYVDRIRVLVFGN